MKTQPVSAWRPISASVMPGGFSSRRDAILETSMYLLLLPDPKSMMMLAPSELSQYPRKMMKMSVSLDLTKMLPFEILFVWKAMRVSASIRHICLKVVVVVPQFFTTSAIRNIHFFWPIA